MSIDNGYQIFIDVLVNVYLVLVVGEQFVDLVLICISGLYLWYGQMIIMIMVFSQIGLVLDVVNCGLVVLFKDWVVLVLYEVLEVVGGLGFLLNCFIEVIQVIVYDVRGSFEDIDDIIECLVFIIDSQVNFGNEIVCWVVNFNMLVVQIVQIDLVV